MEHHVRDEQNEKIIEDMIFDGTAQFLNDSGEGVEGEKLAAPVREQLTAPVRIVMMKKLTAPAPLKSPVRYINKASVH